LKITLFSRNFKFMKIKTILFTLFFMVYSGFCCLAQINFNFINDEHDFGIAEEGITLNYTFEFTNDGKDTIHFKEETRDVRPGCGCTSSEYTKESIPPGGKGFVKAGYNTQGRIGNFNKSITISQKGTPYKILTIKGIVVKKTETPTANPNLKKFPIITLDKKSLDFGKLVKGKSGVYKMNIKNTGKDTLKILSSSSACQCITYKILNLKTNAEEKSILPGKSAFFEITYTPAAPMAMTDSRTNDLITIFTNDPKNSKIELSLQSEIIDK
jgi:archaellum component FlaG (FlaF/FlaG flagellin family)